MRTSKKYATETGAWPGTGWVGRQGGAVKQLGLEEGKECYAVVKATNVMFATSKIEGISARNQIEGTVVKVQEGAVNGHVTIEDEEGARISGSITNESIEALGLKEGGKAVAIIKATDVMVAVD